MKRELIIGTGILVVLLIVLIIIFYPSNEKGKTLENELKECPNDSADDRYKDPDCVTSLAVKYKNESICGSIRPSGGSAGVGPGTNCLIEAYISIGDVNNCDKLRYFYDQEYCRDSIENP